MENDIFQKDLKHIGIVLSFTCNLKCKMCKLWMKPPLSLSLDSIKSILKQAKALGADIFTPFGGEPVLRKDIFEIFSYAHQLGYDIEFVTNGTLINEQVAERLFKYISGISISIEGSKEHHDEIRGNGTFDKAISAVKFLTKYKRRDANICLTMVVTKNSYKYMKKLVDLASELKVDKIFYQPFNRAQARKENVHDFLVPAVEIPVLQLEIESTINYAMHKNVQLGSVIEFKLIPLYFKLNGKIKPTKGCFLPYHDMLIIPNGKVFACPFERIEVGDINENNLDYIWNSEKYEKQREKARLKKCRGCLANCSDLDSYKIESA
ncbi:MAG: radical SAM protein [Spirochaetales bacterium]|nr:radical SAM protein [Spirochaetales bacterium]